MIRYKYKQCGAVLEMRIISLLVCATVCAMVYPGDLAAAKPTASTQAKTKSAPTANRPVLDTGASARIRQIILAQLDQVVGPQMVTVQQIPKGTKLAVTLDGHAYRGIVWHSMSAYRSKRRGIVVSRLYVATSNPWKLNGQTVIPGNVSIVHDGRQCEIVHVPEWEDFQKLKAQVAKSSVGVAVVQAACDRFLKRFPE